jgi:hypothetical protein
MSLKNKVISRLEKLWNNLKTWSIKNKVIAVLSIIIVFLLLRLEYCNKPKIQYLDRTVVDSIIRKSTVDTVYVTNRVIKYVSVPYPDLIKEYKDTCLDLQVNRYTVPVEDTLITGKIIARVTGTLDSLKLDYTYKYPVITKTDSITIYKTRTVYKQPLSLTVGGAIGGNKNTFVAGINAGIITPKGMVYEAQYDFSGKSITFGVKKAFKLQK